MAPTYTEAEITEALMALIAWAGNATAAVRTLKSQEKRTPTAVTLTEWSRSTHLERFNELREKYKDKLEADLAHEMRDIARLASEGQKLALQRIKEHLEQDKEKDPARAAANLATVASKNADKLLALTGRPSQITESRDVGQILRSLVAKGVLAIPDEPKAIEGTVEPGD